MSRSRNVINPDGGPVVIDDVHGYLAMHEDDDEPMVDLGGGMVGPLRELVEDVAEISVTRMGES